LNCASRAQKALEHALRIAVVAQQIRAKGENNEET
jgi:hypothetical protein